MLADNYSIYSVLAKMKPKLATMRDEATSNTQRWTFGLLHDALIFSGDKIHTMNAESLVGFIELTAIAAQAKDPDPRQVKKKLRSMGFDVTPNLLN